MTAISIDSAACTRCGACVAVCSHHVFSGVGEVTAPDACKACGHCVAVCPADAVHHAAFPLDACPPAPALPDFATLTALLRERRSCRVFAKRPVARETVAQLIDAARWVPSASNGQPVDWLAIDDPARIAALSAGAVGVLAATAQILRNPLARLVLRVAHGKEKVASATRRADGFDEMAARHAAGDDPIFFHAPIVLVAHVPKADYFGRDDAVYAAYNLMLAARTLGLGTCQIGFFQVALDRSIGLRAALNLPLGRAPQVTLVLGYPRYDFHRLVPRREPEIQWGC